METQESKTEAARAGLAQALPSDTPARRRVQVLRPSVAERIAAGEVIERPASVVKELVENSIDAGATEVSVLLEDGGKSLIEVMDNGCGMGPEDLATCVLRHATSKLSALEDLENIRTLGFRGEALPSVAAVSDLSILSRAEGADTAYELQLAAASDAFDRAESRPRAATFGHFLNSRHGTRIQARGLFAQVPARLKFLKSQGAEVAQVREWIERLALAHPRVGFRLVSDGRAILTLRPHAGPRDAETERVRAILSDGDDYPVLSGTNDLGFKDRSRGDLHVRVHWLQGLSTPQTRKIVQVVNGRALRDRMLQQALLAPFRQALLPGQFPAVALYIEIDPAQLDVNVHPTKTEIRFLDSRRIFHAVESVVDQLIAGHGAPAYAALSLGGGAPAGQSSAPADLGGRAGEPVPFAEGAGAAFSDRAAGAGAVPFALPAEQGWERKTWGAFESRPRQDVMGFARPAASAFEERRANQDAQPPSGTSEEALAAPAAQHPLSLGRFAGFLFNTYLLYDLGTELALVDQHAAHERIRYERLRRSVLARQGERPAHQALLIPETARFAAEQRPAIEQRLHWLEALGFEAEIFGEDTLLFRAVPADWGIEDLRLRLKNLVERVLAYEPKPGQTEQGAQAALKMDESLFEALASEACHSAIRAGDRLDALEASHLVEQLFACEHPWNCPHGRPSVVRVPRARLEEWFQRRV